MIIILQYICKSNHHTVYLKLIQGYMSITMGKSFKRKKKKRERMEEQIKNKVRISLVVQWLRFHLSVKETHRFDPWSGKTLPAARQLGLCATLRALKPALHNKGEKPMQRNQDPVRPQIKYFQTSRPTLKSDKTKM